MSTAQLATTIPTGTWTIDASHSSVGFSVRHMMVSKTRGRFSSFAGTIDVADDPSASTAEVTIDVSSIDTRDAKRDDHLRSPDFFDASKHPQITFRSTALEPHGDDVFRLVGDLTVKGITRPVTLDVEVGGVAQDPWGGTRVGFTASGTLDRSDFGLEWNAALETGGVLVGDKIKLDLDVEAVKS
ncbi:MAG: YceI family protein [Ilumatobacteraceae bacterium]